MVPAAYHLGRPERLFVVLAGTFLTALVVAEATASKFFVLADLPFTFSLFGWSTTSIVMTAGVIAFPVTFIVTDLINEYFGRAGIRFVTLLGVAMIVFEFAILRIAIPLPTASFSPVPDEAFRSVFGTAGRVIFGSLAAYVVGQFVDIALFHRLREATGGRYLWLRATGSTFGSQFIDTFIVLTVAFAGQLAFGQIVAITLFNYGYKFVIAVLITPLIYAAHAAIDRYLGRNLAERLVDAAEADADVPGTAGADAPA